MKNNTLILILFLLTASVFHNRIKCQLLVMIKEKVVDGKDFMINGMNWDYYPIGTITPIVCGINLMMS
jgi:hypothetical protein